MGKAKIGNKEFDLSNADERKEYWETLATTNFKGKTVARIEWLTDAEVDEMGWYASAPCIVFTDGSWIMAMSDDEGNNAGALATSAKAIQTIPVM